MAAVVHGDDPLVIVAGAGTGKTRTLTSRVARLLERGVAPERILLLTFTRRAADDMLARAAALSGHREWGRRLRGGTFHAIAHQFISAYAEPLGLQAGFSLLDPADAADVMDLLRQAEGLESSDVRMPRSATLVEVYSRCVNTRRRLGEVLATDFPWCEPHAEAIAGLFRSYVGRKRAQGQVDFDDLLLLWRAALADERLGPRMVEMFDHVLVDEYQDVNALQVDIVRFLRPDGRGLTVVGDDAQAIYGFRGSNARYLHDLAGSLQGATVVALERNFRSVQPILTLANLVRPSEAGVRLELEEPTARGPPTGARPLPRRRRRSPSRRRPDPGRPRRGHAALRPGRAGARRPSQRPDRARAHGPARPLPQVRRPPLRRGGPRQGFRRRRPAARQPRRRARLVPPVAHARRHRARPGTHAARARAARLARATLEWSEAVAAAPARSRVALSATLEGLGAARRQVAAVRPGRRPSSRCCARSCSAATRGPARIEDLDRLSAAAAEMEDLSAWLAEITLDPPELDGGPRRAAPSRRGLRRHLHRSFRQGPRVVLGPPSPPRRRAFPSDMALGTAAGLAEERRLFYVATTRARDRLTFTRRCACPITAGRATTGTAWRRRAGSSQKRCWTRLDIEEQTPARPRVGCGVRRLVHRGRSRPPLALSPSPGGDSLAWLIASRIGQNRSMNNDPAVPPGDRLPARSLDRRPPPLVPAEISQPGDDEEPRSSPSPPS